MYHNMALDHLACLVGVIQEDNDLSVHFDPDLTLLYSTTFPTASPASSTGQSNAGTSLMMCWQVRCLTSVAGVSANDMESFRRSSTKNTGQKKHKT